MSSTSIVSWVAAFGLALANANAAASESGTGAAAADLVFYGSHLLTQDPATAGADALAVRGETIAMVGSRDEVAALVGERTRVVELGERALVPGFIDAHGHLALVMGLLDNVNVSSPPVGPARTVDDVVASMATRISEREIPAGEWVVGYGYDDSLLAENRHPNRDDLDRASTEHPIMLMHVSGHFVTLNSAALAARGLDAASEDPPGGVIRRRPGTREPNGVLEETAAGAVLFEQLSKGAQERFAPDLLRAIDHHASYGITTIQDGASAPEWIAGVRAVAAQKPLAVDVVAFPQINQLPLDAPLDSLGYSRDYRDRFRVAGVKFALDGSPQGRTAWLTKPYLKPLEGKGPDYVAYPILEPDIYRAQAKRMLDAGIPILAHANGDAAIDLMIEGVALGIGDARPDHRSVTIHAQLAREDQLDRMAELGIVPSYFAAHPFFWGDWHREIFGDARASRISPMRSTIAREIPLTIHNDAPVVPPDVMRLVSIAVNRKTRSGHVLGPDQRATVDEALYAVTQGSAWAYFEEDRKGSLTAGKQADLVILERDPRAVPAAELADVAVLETFSHGQSVFVRPAAAAPTESAQLGQ